MDREKVSNGSIGADRWTKRGLRVYGIDGVLQGLAR